MGGGVGPTTYLGAICIEFSQKRGGGSGLPGHPPPPLDLPLRLKWLVQQFSGWLSKNCDENPRMRTLLVGTLN